MVGEKGRVREESSKVRWLWGYWGKGLNPAPFALYGPHLRHLVGTPEPTHHLRSSALLPWMECGR